MKPLHHAAASTCFAAGTWAATGSPALALANFAAGTLIDLDHFPEFFWYTRFKKGPFAILTEQLHLIASHTVLPLHSMDLLTLLFYLLYAAGHVQIALVLYIGCVQHLVLDTIYNPVKSPFAYFLAFRIKCGFRTDQLLYPIDLRNKNGY